MFGIGWAELLVIAIVLVVVVKPEQMPEAARSLGRLYGQLQRLIYESRSILARESEEIKRATDSPDKTDPAVQDDQSLSVRSGADHEAGK